VDTFWCELRAWRAGSGYHVPFAAVMCLLLLFWIENGVGAPPGDATDQFYDPGVLQTIHLEVKPEELDRLHRALPQRIFVPATFRWNDQVLANVGLRYKGNSSSIPNAQHKRGFLINFQRYNRDQQFLGLQRVGLDNGVQFGSLFSERLITEALLGLGVKVSRCNYAQVYVNGQHAGVYVNVERLDQPFLERQFGAGGGALFKVDEGGPGADLRYVSRDPAIYRKTFDLKSGNEKGAFEHLLEFIRAVDAAPGERVDLRQHLDVEAFLKTTAVMLFAGAFDQYTGWAPHNYYLYRDPVDFKWTYIPWDLDVGFADNAFGRVPVLEGWHAAWPTPVPGRPLMEHIVSDPVLLERYREEASAILETWFRPEVLVPKLRALHGQIRTALDQDPFPPRRATVPSDSGYPDILWSMETFIRKRYAMARAQLDAPGDRPPFKPMLAKHVQDGPKPGPHSTDAPTDLHAVNVKSGRVELRWTDHAQGEVAFVVQRCAGAECMDFANRIGQAGADITTAVDHDVQPGMTYRYRVYAVLPTPEGPRGTGTSNVISVTIPELE
jgi:hypothetical protein